MALINFEPELLEVLVSRVSILETMKVEWRPSAYLLAVLYSRGSFKTLVSTNTNVIN